MTRPSKDKFLATTRAFSHGCIRLSRPMDLAYRLVGEIAGWSKAKIDGAFASGKTTRVACRSTSRCISSMPRPSRVGGIEFRPDVYGRDRKLDAALFGKPSS